MDFVKDFLPYADYLMGFYAITYLAKIGYVVGLHYGTKKRFGESDWNQISKETKSARTRTLVDYAILPFPLDLHYIWKLQSDRLEKDRSG